MSCRRNVVVVTRGATRGGTIPRAPKRSNNVASTFFNSTFASQSLYRFKHWWRQIVYCPSGAI